MLTDCWLMMTDVMVVHWCWLMLADVLMLWDGWLALAGGILLAWRAGGGRWKKWLGEWGWGSGGEEGCGGWGWRGCSWYSGRKPVDIGMVDMRFADIYNNICPQCPQISFSVSIIQTSVFPVMQFCGSHAMDTFTSTGAVNEYCEKSMQKIG